VWKGRLTQHDLLNVLLLIEQLHASARLVCLVAAVVSTCGYIVHWRGGGVVIICVNALCVITYDFAVRVAYWVQWLVAASNLLRLYPFCCVFCIVPLFTYGSGVIPTHWFLHYVRRPQDCIAVVLRVSVS
jgi:hypothetical protein